MKGIAFSAEMAQAIYEGRKTQTRRVMKPQPDAGKMRWNGAYWEMHMGYPLGHDVPVGKYSIGERLYVQEPWRIGAWKEVHDLVALDYTGYNRREWLEVPRENASDFFYSLRKDLMDSKAQMGKDGLYHWDVGESPLPWKSPITMPQWAARSIIEIAGIKTERLQDITEEDAKAEGATTKIDPLSFDSGTATCTYRYGFYDVWQNLYPDHPVKGWDANPWVWVYKFKRVEDGKW